MASERSCGQLEPEEIIRLERERVVMLDQRRLPADVVELECDSAAAVARAIRALAIRGAPAIGVAGAMGVALAAALGDDLDEAEALLARARPTAVNLAWAVRKARRAGDDPLAIAAAARRIHRDEVGRCRSMSKHAVPLLE
ncbi:MAG: hypothetical protein ACE5EV_05370, partial [Gaiellales bacterium]